MNSTVNEIKKLMPEIRTRFPAIDVFYVFGSQVKSKVDLGSDIDIGVYIENDKYKINKLIDLELSVFLQEIFSKEVDVVVMNSGSAVIQYEIIKTGIRLYEKDHSKRAYLELNAFREFIDATYFQQKRLCSRPIYG